MMNKRNILCGLGFIGSLAIGSIGGYFGRGYHANIALGKRHAEVVQQAHDELYKRTFPSLLSARRERNSKARYLIEELKSFYPAEEKRLYEGTENIDESKKPEVVFSNLETTLRRCRTPNLSPRFVSEFHELSEHVRWLEGRTGLLTAYILGANGAYESNPILEPGTTLAGIMYEQWRNTLSEGRRRE